MKASHSVFWGGAGVEASLVFFAVGATVGLVFVSARLTHIRKFEIFVFSRKLWSRAWLTHQLAEGHLLACNSDLAQRGWH